MTLSAIWRNEMEHTLSAFAAADPVGRFKLVTDFATRLPDRRLSVLPGDCVAGQTRPPLHQRGPARSTYPFTPAH